MTKLFNINQSTSLLLITLVLSGLTPSKAWSFGSGKPTNDPDVKQSTQSCCQRAWGMKNGKSYQSKGTGYYPANNSMEGGFYDRKGNKLQTVQGFLHGGADYVSAAMDVHAFAYGTPICIPELNNFFGEPLRIKVVDTGSAFTGKGTSRIDICMANNQATQTPVVNSKLTIISCQ